MTDSESEFQNSHQFQTDFVNNKMIQAVDLYSDEQGLFLKRSSIGQSGRERPDVASLVLPMILQLKFDGGTSADPS